jgi:hypothetical protein
VTFARVGDHPHLVSGVNTGLMVAQHHAIQRFWTIIGDFGNLAGDLVRFARSKELIMVQVPMF